MKNCNNCAWYCHSDGNCYGTKARLFALVPASKAFVTSVSCESWAYDGLEDWEREELDQAALVTMETL